ncbi:MAG: 1-acyl-sn-glycerol-3-phosphate acyltransferase [Armatimonadia bacterium]|nr:1-acyl-sn-glycerol-3-phosphate acyltransferase [Armatimonadia bacterium]
MGLYEPPRRWTWPHYRFAQWIIPKITTVRGGWRVRGVENVPDEGGALIAANHLSHLDPPVVGSAMRRRTYYFAAAYLFKNPVFGFLIRKCYAFPVRRGAADRAALKAAIELLELGELLTMFPEGTRSRTGELGEFDLGAALAASRAGVPIVPCAISGTNLALPRDAKRLKRSRIAVSFAEPIDTLQFGAKPRKDDLQRITDQVEAAVREMKAEQAPFFEDAEAGQEPVDEQ